MEVKAAQFCFMTGISCPCFIAVQQGAEDASSVDADLACQGKLPVLPYLLLSLAMVAEALPILMVISLSRERLLVMVAPKYVKVFTTSKGVPSIMTLGGLSTSWPMTLVFLMLIVRPNSLQACENPLSSSLSSSAVLLTNAAASANSSSWIRIVLILVFALNLAKLNSLPSDLVCRKTPSWESWKAYCRSVKISNSVGARTHLWFTPLVILKGWDEVQSKLNFI